MQQLDHEIDGNGMLLGARAHDAAVLALQFTAAGTLTVDFRCLSGSHGRLVLDEVREMNIVSLWDGAILSEIFVWPASQVPEQSWEIPDSGWNLLFRDRLLRNDAHAAAAAIASRLPQPFLVTIDCAYGGHVAAVCGAVRVFSEGGD